MVYQGMGFGDNEKEPSIEKRDGYFGRFICVHQNGNSVLGILKDIDQNNNLAYFQPSLVGCADGTLDVETGLPTRMRLPLGIIRPLKGTIEDYAESYNLKLKSDKDKQGEQK